MSTDDGPGVETATGPRPSVAGRATSGDVARRAGVSRATVSHILNGQTGRFSPETVTRVLGSASELNYVPSSAGRALARGRSDFVLVVLADTTLSNVQDIVDAVATELARHGLGCVVHMHAPKGAGDPEGRLRTTIETLRPFGLIDFGGLDRQQLIDLADRGCAILSPALDPVDELDGNVHIAHVQAGHLLQRGYTQLGFAFLDDRRDDPFGRVRSAEITRLCISRDLPPPVRLDIPLEVGGAARALARALTGTDERLGLACSSDEVGIAVAAAARVMGVEVPGRLGIVGVGGSPVAGLVSPRLTTVSFELVASLKPVFDAIARICGAPAASPEAPAEPYTVLLGETT